MKREELIDLIHSRRSFLCVGLDVDKNKMPEHLRNDADGVFKFNKAIIDATIDYAVAYKPNLAFYEAMGIEGLVQLKKTMDYLHGLDKKAFTIADAKRGDIGNTSQQYAKAFLDPAGDFNFLPVDGERKLFEKVLETSRQWGNPENMMYVVGATKADMLTQVRAIVPDSFLLVPGVGAQGGSLEEVCKYGLTRDCGLLVNSSRGIIYASTGVDFAERAGEEAQKLQQQMDAALSHVF